MASARSAVYLAAASSSLGVAVPVRYTIDEHHFEPLMTPLCSIMSVSGAVDNGLIRLPSPEPSKSTVGFDGTVKVMCLWQISYDFVCFQVRGKRGKRRC